MGAKELKYYDKNYYYSLPEGERVELIDGLIYDMSASPLTSHQILLGELHVEIAMFIRQHGGKCRAIAAPFDVELADDTIVQPDISVICDPSKLTRKGCTGAPDWIIEITSSNAINDYIRKLNIYARYGVREYWIVNPNEKDVLVYRFGDEDNFSRKNYSFSDTIPVGIYDGDLKINIAQLMGTYEE